MTILLWHRTYISSEGKRSINDSSQSQFGRTGDPSGSTKSGEDGASSLITPESALLPVLLPESLRVSHISKSSHVSKLEMSQSKLSSRFEDSDLLAAKGLDSLMASLLSRVSKKSRLEL